MNKKSGLHPKPGPKKRETKLVSILNGKPKKFLIAAVIFGTGVTFFSAFVTSSFLLQGSLVRERVSSKTAGELKTAAGYLPFKWFGMTVSSAGFAAKGKPGQALTRLEASGLTAHCNLFSLWHRIITIDEFDVQHLQIAYGDAAASQVTDELSPRPELHEPDNSQSLLKVNVVDTRINAADIFWGKEGDSLGFLKNVMATVRTEKSNLEIEGKNGIFRQDHFPELKVDRFTLHYEKPHLLVREGKFKLGEGDLTIHGDFEFSNKSSLNLLMEFTSCPVSPFLPGEWKDRLQAHLTAKADMFKELSTQGMLKVSGNIRLEKARLQRVPAQKKLAAITHKTEFNELAFTTLKCDFIFQDKKLEIRNIEAEVNGLFSVTGEFTSENGTIAAYLSVGVDPSALDPIPGARERVFTKSRGKYVWTTMKINGSLKHPHEDLSPRLLAAAKEQIVGRFLRPVTEPENLLLTTLEHLFW